MFKRFFKNKRGVSTVIGTIFFVVVLIGGFSMIMWETTQYHAYMQVVNDRNQLDWEKQNEIIEIMSVDVVDASLNISVINKGAVTAHLVDLWVTEYLDTTANWHRLFQIDYYLNPGNTTTNIGQELEAELDPDLAYKVKIVTERGNTAVSTYPEFLPDSPPPVHAFGVFSLDWFYFKYADKQTSGELRDAGAIDIKDDYVSFYIRVTNNYDESMALLNSSMLMLLIPWVEPIFYIVGAVEYTPDPPQITAYDNGNPIIVHPRESVVLIFAAKEIGGTSWTWRKNGFSLFGAADQDIGAIVMTGLVFTMESDPDQIEAQSLPFQALVILV